MSKIVSIIMSVIFSVTPIFSQVSGTGAQSSDNESGKVLIAYFSMFGKYF